MKRHDIKIKRLEKTYMQVISKAIVSELDDARFEGEYITVTRVEFSDEVDETIVFITMLNPNHKNKVIKALYCAAPYFLNILKNKIKIKYLPPMKFRYDEKDAKAMEVMTLIDDISRATKKQSFSEDESENEEESQ